jgi:hypothetical protein
MLYALGRAYQGKVGEGIVFLFSLPPLLPGLLRRGPSCPCRAWRGRFRRKAFVQPFDLAFGFDQVHLEAFAQPVEPCRLGHFGERLVNCFSA